MNQKNKKNWRIGTALILVLCMLVSASGHILPARATGTGAPTSYTVTLGQGSRYFVCNETPTNGPVTLTYTVESSSISAEAIKGVVATANPEQEYPYSGNYGSTKYNTGGQGILAAGYTFSLTMSLDANGKIAWEGNYTNGTVNGTPTLAAADGNGNAQSKYFGVYFSSLNSAKLINVTCTDAEGNDLGVYVKAKSGDFTVEENEIEETPSYTVTLGQGSRYFVCNEIPTSGPVTLTYTVESSSISAEAIKGVVATANPEQEYPYSGNYGSTKYNTGGQGILAAGYTFSLTMSLDANGKIAWEGNYTNGTVNGTPTLAAADGNGNAQSKYFGVYFSSLNSAKLINVTCTDAEGNDLGVYVKAKSGDFTVEANEIEQPEEPGEETPSYTVTLGQGSRYFVCNETPTSGPVTLTYTVESSSISAEAIKGVVATANPEQEYPYSGNYGSTKYNVGGQGILAAGYTFSLTMSLDANGKIAWEGNYTNGTVNGTPTLATADGNGNAQSKYFGVYFSSLTSAKLINVTCTDAQGNDLGVYVKAKTGDFTVESNKSEPENPDNPDNPDNPGDEEQEGYTVTLGADSNYYLCNETPTNGPVTLTYTVESAEVPTTAIKGVAASAYPNEAYPYDGNQGSMIYNNTGTGITAVGYTFTMTMSLDSNGKIQTTPAYEKVDGTASGNSHLPHVAGNGNAEGQYFGIYISNVVSAKLINVTCTDAEGNDLGLRVQDSKTNYTIVSNNATEPEEPNNPEEPGDEEKSGYTVVLNGDSNYFISNKKPAKGPVTMTYTVESSAAAGEIVNGVVATAHPKEIYPYDGNQGSMIFRQDKNGVLLEGYSYSFTMSLDANQKISFSGTYNDGTNSGSPYLPHKAGNGNAESQYFGIYLSRVTAAKLIYVNFTDAEGNDLGVQVNQASSSITSPGEELDYIRPEKDLPSEHKTEQKINTSFRRATAGTFNVAEGSYTNSKASGLYALSMHKLIFSVEIKFSEATYSDIRYAGKSAGYGLTFNTEGENLTMKDAQGNTGIYMFDSSIAGVDFTGNTFNFKLSTEYVDRDKDGVKDDVKLGVWFNDKLYANRYIYLLNYQLGKYLTVQSTGDNAFIQLNNTKGIATGVDYTIFGYTSNWRKELGIK